MKYSDFFYCSYLLSYLWLPSLWGYGIFTMVEALLMLSLLTITGFLEAIILRRTMMTYDDLSYSLEKMINSWVANQVPYGDFFAILIIIFLITRRTFRHTLLAIDPLKWELKSYYREMNDSKLWNLGYSLVVLINN